jgi:hypothetical protein
MSIRPATIYLGTRSHFRREKRSGRVKSYRALLSTAIRRKFGASESGDDCTADSGLERFTATGSAGNNNNNNNPKRARTTLPASVRSVTKKAASLKLPDR